MNPENESYLLKQFHIEAEGISLKPLVLELVPYYFTWPASQVMSLYVISNKDKFLHTKVLELGAGSGLVSMVVAQFASLVILSERADEINALKMLRYSVQLNQLNNSEVVGDAYPLV